MTKNDPSTRYTAKKRPKFGQKSPNITWQLLNPSENQLKIYFKGPKLSKNWGKHPDLIFDWQKYLKMTLGLLKRPENPLKLGKNTKKWPKNIKNPLGSLTNDPYGTASFTNQPTLPSENPKMTYEPL